VPRLTVWMVRTALLYLAAGFAVGAVLLAAHGLALPVDLRALRPLHAEFLLLGWTGHLALGVAFWILPRLGAEGRGNEDLAWAAYWLLSFGVAVVGGSRALGLPGGVALLGRTAEGLAAAAFACHAWPRVRSVSTPQSEP
jgi:cbb3-type cytochrome oxidase subunit 1